MSVTVPATLPGATTTVVPGGPAPGAPGAAADFLAVLAGVLTPEDGAAEAPPPDAVVGPVLTTHLGVPAVVPSAPEPALAGEAPDLPQDEAADEPSPAPVLAAFAPVPTPIPALASVSAAPATSAPAPSVGATGTPTSAPVGTPGSTPPGVRADALTDAPAAAPSATALPTGPSGDPRAGEEGPREQAPSSSAAPPATSEVRAAPTPAAPGVGPNLGPALTPTGSAAAPAPVVPTTTAGPGPQLDRVSAQVFPEVTGLVSRGPGTHRITLTLNPEQLGEVRVVMTMRSGAVHVRLAAAQEAQAALLEGSPELSRLLEHAGATEARVVVRDLPAASSAPTTPAGSSAGTHLDLGAGADAGRSTDQHAGTRAEHPATDGADHTRHPGNPAVAEVRPTQPVTGSRSAGVDLAL